MHPIRGVGGGSIRRVISERVAGEGRLDDPEHVSAAAVRLPDRSGRRLAALLLEHRLAHPHQRRSVALLSDADRRMGVRRRPLHLRHPHLPHRARYRRLQLHLAHLPTQPRRQHDRPTPV